MINNNKGMKTLKFIVSLLLAMCLQDVTAQVNNINVNGLILGNIYSKQDVQHILNKTPLATRGPQENDIEPNTYIMYFNEDVIELSNFIFFAATLKCNHFWIGGPGRQIRVGDNISRLQPCLGGTFSDVQVNYSENAIAFKDWKIADYPYEGYEVRFYYNAENIITKIYVAINPL